MSAITDAIVYGIRKFLRIEPPQERHVVIRDLLTHEGNCAKNRIWYRGLPNQLSEFYRALPDSTLFWAAKQTRGLEIRKIHTGLPAIVIDMIVNIVCNDFNGIEFESENTNKERWEEIAKDNDFEELLSEAVKECAIVGDGAFKISVDPEISENPILEFYPADRVRYVYKRGRLREVHFYTEIKHDHKLYELVEKYGYGFIRYELRAENGKKLELDAIPETAWAKGKDVSFDEALIWAVPMIYSKSAVYKGRGKALLDSKDTAGDALDESISQWMDALRAGRTQTYIPETLVPRDPVTLTPIRPNAFDNRFIAVGDNMQENGRSEIKNVSPEIRHDAYLATYITALDLFLQGVISPSTIGIDVKKLDNAEAQREKEKTTLYTRQNFVEMIQKTLPKLVLCVLNADLALRSQPLIKDIEIKAKFGEYANPSFESQVETVGKAKTNGIMSIEQSVEELYGDSKDDEWKAAEVARIKNEQGIVELSEPKTLDDLTLV